MEASERRPAGIPIGRALDIPAGMAYDDMRHAIVLVDRVHGDGRLPPTPIRLFAGIAERDQLRFDPATGAPISILVRPSRHLMVFVVLHEIGHLLDLVALGEGPRFGSYSNPLLSDWRDSISASRAHAELMLMAMNRAAEAFAGSESSSTTLLSSDEHIGVRRLLEPEELWARAYAQYVAIRSGDPIALAGLGAIRDRPPRRVYYPRQWEDDDFETIGLAIDVLFRGLG